MQNIVFLEFNPNGSIKGCSVSHLERVVLKRRETQTIKQMLSNARNYGKVRLHQIAVIDEKEFMRVKAEKFNGSAWIEVQ